MFGSPYEIISCKPYDIELHYDRPNARIISIPIKSLHISNASYIKEQKYWYGYDTVVVERWKLVASLYPGYNNSLKTVTKDFIYDCHININNISDRNMPILTYSKLELCKVSENKIELMAKYRSPW